MNINPADIIISLLLAAAIIAAIISVVRQKKKGKGCCHDCESCSRSCCKTQK